MADQEPSQNESLDNESQSGENGENNQPNNDDAGLDQAAQDLARVSSCTHDNLSGFVAESESDAQGTTCDFNGEPELHKAFDYVGDHALICDHCFAVICKNCYDEHN